jgi:hypothetical protein
MDPLTAFECTPQNFANPLSPWCPYGIYTENENTSTVCVDATTATITVADGCQCVPLIVNVVLGAVLLAMLAYYRVLSS